MRKGVPMHMLGAVAAGLYGMSPPLVVRTQPIPSKRRRGRTKASAQLRRDARQRAQRRARSRRAARR